MNITAGVRNDQAPQQLPEQLPLLAVLGLADPASGDWGRIRALQHQEMNKLALLRILSNAIAGAIVVQLFFNTIALPFLAAWFVLMCGLAVTASVIFTPKDAADYKRLSLSEGRRIAIGQLGVGLVWTIPILFFAPYGDLAAMVGTWTVLATLMAGSALLLSAAPLGTFLFVIALTAASVGAFIGAGYMFVGLAVAAFALLLLTACLENAKSYLRYKLSEATLNEKSEVVSLLLREFEESGADWLWQIDTSRHVVHASPRFAYALGREAKDVEGKSLIQLIAGDSWESGKFASSLHDLAEKLKRREAFSNLLVRVSINGEPRWWELSASPKLDDNGVFLGFRGVGSDVTEQRESAEKIARMARYDTLTGLPNRLQLTEALGKAMQQAEQWRGRCGFMMIDLDRFKSVNDTLGHLVGDRLLSLVSQRLRSIMSENEMCGRLGGDEFAVVLRDASDSRQVSELAKRIIDTLSRPYDVDQHTIYVGASVGSAVGPRDGRTVEMLMRSADLALYRSKDEGGCLHHAYEPKLHVHAEERRVMEIALRKALENNEFSINYQPVVSASSDGIVGFEALLRWHNPEFGNVSPAKFVPLAEEARLIVPIGEWVLRQACHEATNWPETVRIAVNVSAEQLTDQGFTQTVVSALSHSGLAPNRLELEVTESVFMREGSGAEHVLDQILALGVGLSLDDFGTGYSSLGYLRKTRFTTIKVDRSFVQGAAKNVPESLAIIRAVVAMADSLGMSTTAEGAETDHEVEMIKALGCKKIQGYFYGRPMPAKDVRDMFHAYQASQQTRARA